MAFPIIDFHCHHVPRRFPLTTLQNAPASQRGRWAATNRLIADEALLVADIEAGDIDARVVNTPTAHICDAAGNVPHETIMRVNDELAALQSRHPGRIHALATVDVYDGERAARELERAVGQLGLRGVFAECARGQLLIDAPEARPTLETAAHLRVPVFVHPVNPQPLLGQMEPYGRLGTLLARGTVNAQALIALVESGVLRRLTSLQIVVTALAFGGLALAAGFSHMSRESAGQPADPHHDPARLQDLLRRHVLIDTMGFDATMIRAAVAYLGAGNVIVGSDWPIVSEGPIRSQVHAALDGLPPPAAEAIAAGNARRLLRL